MVVWAQIVATGPLASTATWSANYLILAVSPAGMRRARVLGYGVICCYGCCVVSLSRHVPEGDVEEEKKISYLARDDVVLTGRHGSEEVLVMQPYRLSVVCANSPSYIQSPHPLLDGEIPSNQCLHSVLSSVLGSQLDSIQSLIIIHALSLRSMNRTLVTN